jgi:hypothetical protein
VKNNLDSVRRVVAAYRRHKQADQPAGARQQAKRNALPINKPKGIDKTVVKENGVSKTKGEDVVKPHSRDIQPKDVFPATPNNTGVLSLVQSGKDLSQALENQIPKDKGHDVVYNLSQYLIRTEGNGGEGTAKGKKK